MTGLGLGCAKTPAPAAHVETSRRNCAPWSRIVLRARCSIPCWRIVFSTFRNCMSFHTGWVKLGRAGDVRCTTALPPKADVHPRSCYVAFGRVEDGRGRLGHAATLRFPSPLIEPDVPD